MIPAKVSPPRAPPRPLAPFAFDRRDPRPSRRADRHPVLRRLPLRPAHGARRVGRRRVYPCVPGHEIVGRVAAVGAAVTKFKVGDLRRRRLHGRLVPHLRQLHARASSSTASSGCTVHLQRRRQARHGRRTYGGYSDSIVVDEHFVLRIPRSLDLAGAAPLLCAGITTYSPLRHWKVGQGKKVGVVGLGGLGHMGVKFAHALGAQVVAVHHLAGQGRGRAAARRRRGRRLQGRRRRWRQHAGSFDFILDTVAAPHDLNAYLDLLEARRHA